MKNILVFLFASLFLSCNQEEAPRYVINGVFEKGIGEQLLLEELSNQRVIKVIDSARVDSNGKFSFSGDSFGEIKEARLSISGTKFREDFIIEDTIINVTIEQKNVTKLYTKYIFNVERGKEDAIYAKLKANYSERRTVWGVATNRLVRANEANKLSDEELAIARQELDEGFVEEVVDTLSNYPNSYGTYFYIKNYMLRYDPLPSVEEAFNNLSENIKASKEATVFKSEVEEIKRSFVGGTPDDFSIPSLDGGQTTLYEYRGKVLLVDCWATWCGPCIEAMPHIGEIYKEFSPQGLEVLGISYDKDETRWREFLKKNEYITWDQASSLKEWACPSSKVFSVTMIPATILIDKNGVVAGRNLKGEELEAKIKELLALN
ncbi:TlpA disulfide reductase family protein [Polaribacter sp. AHE13PA]|uniref:TlpA disulfide reductase family protein n=1 Tax=Polaribacter sp. AHE13PA TaxID=2745562 RepID=UPI001C4FA619|nr:TlpA disulfide reductase family protein [Polaribacter sp. AHE13PA]QXP66643.1 AhpC/TSA family protein [Polaribacter sp. AHE13PA]